MSSAAPAPAAPAKKTASLTAYHVLLHSEDNAAWMLMAEDVQARSANEAIRASAKNNAGTDAAVPSRSWKPVSVTVETQTVIKLGGSAA